MEGGVNSESSNGSDKATGARTKTPALPTSTRMQRNQAEKQRRDRLNGYISELATLVPMVSNASKPLDKVSILRLAAAQMRLNISCLNPKKFKCKPVTLPSTVIQYLDVLEKTIGGFILVTTFSGCIVFCSKSIEDYVGYQNIDVMGNSVYNYIHSGDVTYFEKKVNSVISRKKSSKKKKKVIKVHMQQRPLPRSNDVRYRKMIFKLSVHVNEIKESGSNGQTPTSSKVKKTGRLKDFGASAVVLMFIEPVRLEPEIDISYIESHQDAYFTMHGLKGEIIYADQRISSITGYMPHDVQGTSAYQYISSSDVPIALFAQKAMFTSNDGTGVIVYRLRIRDMRYIYLQSSGQIAYKDSSSDVSHFVCFNKLLSDEEGSQELKKFQQRFAPQIMAAKLLQGKKNDVNGQSPVPDLSLEHALTMINLPLLETSSLSGTPALPGTSALPETVALPGTSVMSGTSALPGTSAMSGTSALARTPNLPGTSRLSMTPNLPGTSGLSGTQNLPGTSGLSRTQNLPGTSGLSRTQNLPGTSGLSRTPTLPGKSTFSGTPALLGTSSFCGTSTLPSTSALPRTAATSGSSTDPLLESPSGIAEKNTVECFVSPAALVGPSSSIHSSEGHSLISPNSDAESGSSVSGYNGSWTYESPSERICEQPDFSSPEQNSRSMINNDYSVYTINSYDSVNIVPSESSFGRKVHDNGVEQLRMAHDNGVEQLRVAVTNKSHSGNGVHLSDYFPNQQNISYNGSKRQSKSMHSVNVYSTLANGTETNGVSEQIINDRSVNCVFDPTSRQTTSYNLGSTLNNPNPASSINNDITSGMNGQCNGYTTFNEHNLYTQVSDKSHNFNNTQSSIHLSVNNSAPFTPVYNQEMCFKTEHSNDLSSFSGVYEISNSSLPKLSNRLSVDSGLGETMDFTSSMTSYVGNGSCSNNYISNNVGYNNGSTGDFYDGRDAKTENYGGNYSGNNYVPDLTVGFHPRLTFNNISSSTKMVVRQNQVNGDVSIILSNGNFKPSMNGYQNGSSDECGNDSGHSTNSMDWDKARVHLDRVENMDSDLNKELYHELDLFFQNLPPDPQDTCVRETNSGFSVANSSCLQNSILSSRAKTRYHQ